MYLKYVNDFSSVNGYMYFHSKWFMSIFAWVGAHIGPIVQTKFFELNIKLFKLSTMRSKKVVITFAAIVFFVKLSLMMINRTEGKDASEGTRLIYPKTVKSLVKIKKRAKYVRKRRHFTQYQVEVPSTRSQDQDNYSDQSAKEGKYP